MSDLPRFEDDSSLIAWLETRPPEDRAIIAHRAAMRVVPIWLTALNTSPLRESNYTALTILRPNLVTGVGCSYPEDDFAAALTAAQTFSAGLTADQSENVPSIVLRAFEALETTRTTHTIRTHLTAGSAARTVYNARNTLAYLFTGRPDARSDFHASVRGDADLLSNGSDLSKAPLWITTNPLAPEWEGSKSTLRETPGGDFWIDWYQRALDGLPQNWPLLRDVALIDNALWEEGGEGLDREIRHRVERHQLLDEVRRLKAHLADAGGASAALPHRGHNHPPELVETYRIEVAGEVEKIVERLDEAERELQEERPSPSALRKIGQGLKSGAMAVIGYCAKLGDLAAQAVAKEIGSSIGKWAGPGLVGYVVANSDAFQKLGEQMMKFADKL